MTSVHSHSYHNSSNRSHDENITSMLHTCQIFVVTCVSNYRITNITTRNKGLERNYNRGLRQAVLQMSYLRTYIAYYFCIYRKHIYIVHNRLSHLNIRLMSCTLTSFSWKLCMTTYSLVSHTHLLIEPLGGCIYANRIFMIWDH